jgi:hypothetical protein
MPLFLPPEVSPMSNLPPGVTVQDIDDHEELELLPVKIGVGEVVHIRYGKGQTWCGLGSSKLWHTETIMPEGTLITCKKCQRWANRRRKS